MKRLTLVFALMALTLAFTHCKKEQPATDEGVRITLTAGYGGDRTAFTPSTGAFVWSDGVTEYIYVGGSNHEACLGVLSGTGTGTGSMTFSGTLTTTPDEGETLHFFYLGKGRDGSAVSTLDFSNQDGTLENVTNYHIAVGDGSYTSGTVNYATTLEMKMAIAYFDVSGFQNASNTAETVYLHGDEVYTTATVDYTTGTITGTTKGYINMGTATAGKYVALIPSVETATTLKFDSDSKTGSMRFVNGIRAGKYYVNGTEALSVTANALLEGTIPGLFSVSATKMVRFSKGNLQYIGSAATPYWKFADNQWIYLGKNGQGSDAANVDRDLFGWGTSGYNHNSAAYQPWSTSTNNWDYYAYGNYSLDLYYGTGKADWGYNAILNGGDKENNGWHTLTYNEWDCVFSTRTGADSKKGHGNVNGVNGLILLPDEWTLPEGLNFTSGNSNWVNVYNAEQWAQMEANGAVFLPAAGVRYGTGINNVGVQGIYWSSLHCGGNEAYTAFFYSGYSSWYTHYRYSAISVRLVRNAD